MTIIDAPLLTACLATAGIPITSIRVADSRYAKPTRKWLLEDFPPYYRATLKNLAGGGEYVEEQWDCDDYSDEFVCCARRAYKRTVRLRAGLAVGRMWFTASAGRHSICVALVERNRVIFVEPQAGVGQVELSGKELQSCDLALF